jgi:hypothetical protein
MLAGEVRAGELGASSEKTPRIFLSYVECFELTPARSRGPNKHRRRAAWENRDPPAEIRGSAIRCKAGGTGFAPCADGIAGWPQPARIARYRFVIFAESRI